MSSTVTVADGLDLRRGRPIQLRCSTLQKYLHNEGAWIDMAKAATKTSYYIIIQDREDGLIATHAPKENCWDADPKPSTLTEAAFDQYPELKVALDRFTLALARCRVPINKKLSNMIRKSHVMSTRKVMRRGRKEWWYVDESELPPPSDSMRDSSHSL